MFEISGKDERLILVIPDNGYKPSSVSPSGEFSELQSTKNDAVYIAKEGIASETTNPHSPSKIVADNIVPKNEKNIKNSEEKVKLYHGSNAKSYRKTKNGTSYIYELDKNVENLITYYSNRNAGDNLSKPTTQIHQKDATSSADPAISDTSISQNEKNIKNDEEKVKLYHGSDTKLVNDSLHVEPKDIKVEPLPFAETGNQSLHPKYIISKKNK
jgi:hypothetical protein